jgi:hypothetical protein
VQGDFVGAGFRFEFRGRDEGGVRFLAAEFGVGGKRKRGGEAQEAGDAALSSAKRATVPALRYADAG